MIVPRRQRNQPSTTTEEARRALAPATEFTFQARPKIPEQVSRSEPSAARVLTNTVLRQRSWLCAVRCSGPTGSDVKVAMSVFAGVAVGKPP